MKSEKNLGGLKWKFKTRGLKKLFSLKMTSKTIIIIKLTVKKIVILDNLIHVDKFDTCEQVWFNINTLYNLNSSDYFYQWKNLDLTNSPACHMNIRDIHKMIKRVERGASGVETHCKLHLLVICRGSLCFSVVGLYIYRYIYKGLLVKLGCWSGEQLK